LCKVGELSKAGELVREMGLKGIGLNMQTYRIMIDGLASNGKIVEACGLFEEALDKGLCTQSLMFDEIICGLCHRDLSCKALKLLEKMVGKNVSPGARAWKALLLSSGFKLDSVETKLFSLVDSNQTQLSSENVAVE
jgi:pentatricopeptide repeat protein